MIRQSFAWWSFAMAPDTDARALLAGAAGAGAKGVEMLPDDLWPVAQGAAHCLGHPPPGHWSPSHHIVQAKDRSRG